MMVTSTRVTRFVVRGSAASLLSLALVACGGGPTPTTGNGAIGNNTGDPDQQTPDEPPPPPPVAKEAKPLFEDGVKAYKAGNHSQAIQFFEQAIDVDDTFGAAYFNIGRIHEEQGRLDEARTWYERSADKGKDFGDGLVNLGRLAMEKGDKGEAMGLFRKAIEVEPFNGEAHLNLAQDARSRRDFANAVKRVRTALKENSQNVKAYEVLARVYYDLGRFELSKLVCLTGIEIQKTPDLHNTLGLVHLEQDNVTLALGAFEDALKADNGYWPAHMNVGAITFGYRDYESSYRHFDEVLKKKPDHLQAMLSKAVAARGLNRLDEAEAGYKAVLAKDETYVGAHYNLGILYQEYTQKLEDSIKSYEMVLRHERENADLRKDVTQRIQAVRIQIENMKQLEEMMRQQKAQEAAEAAQGGGDAGGDGGGGDG